ncbi:MAG: dihydrofolate reductase [Nanoarchaeota archaeon]
MIHRPKQVIIVAAVADGLIIGNKGKIPWWDDDELRREDMRHFRALTLEKPVIIGHTTFRTIGKLLPDRTNIIISRRDNLRIPGASVCNDCDTALFVGHTFHDEVYVIGGGQVYTDMIRCATRLEMTEIHGRYDGDTTFPPYKGTGEWCEVARNDLKGFSFVTYARHQAIP